MIREWKTERMKVRGWKIGLILLAFLALVALWTTWALHGIPKEQMDDGYWMMLLQIPLMDKGDTLKLLYTLQRKEHVFDIKLLMGTVYLTLFVAAEAGLIFLQGARLGFARPMDPVQLLYFVLQIYAVCLLLLRTRFCLWRRDCSAPSWGCSPGSSRTGF